MPLLQPAGVPLRIGTFNLGISQDMLMNTFVKKHRAKYQHIMERLVCEGELDVLACCEVGGHRQGPSAANIGLAEALEGLAAVHRTVGAYTITYTTPMPPPQGSPAAALQRGVELQTEPVVVRLQTEPVVVSLDKAEAHYAHKVDPHFVVTEFKVARDPLCLWGLTTLLVGQLHVRTPSGKKSPSIEQRQRIVKAATDYLEMRQIGGAGQPAVPNVVLVGDPNLTGPLGRAIHQRAEGAPAITDWQTATTTAGRRGDMLWYRGFTATPFDICVGASYAERGMRNDDHDALGLACMLSMPPGSKAAEDCPASSWPGPDGKCSKHASILSSMAPDKTLGVFGNAKFSARGPRPRFQHMLMILGGRKSWL